MRLNGIASTLRRFACSPLTVYRWAATTYAATGYAAPGAQFQFNVDASVQPMREPTLNRERGADTEDRVLVYTTALLQVAEDGSGPADQFDYNGRRYVVALRRDWDVHGAYYAYEAELIP